MDFEKFITNLNLGHNSFVYLDPPYLISMSEYNKLWTEETEIRLYELLDSLNNKGIRFGITNLVYHKGKTNDIFLDWSKKLEFFELKKQNLLNIIPIILIVFCIFSAFTFTSTVHYNEDFNKNKVIADYLTEYDSDYMSKDVAVFHQRSYNWFLKKYTIPITDDQLDYLESSNITYYISDDNFNLSNYTIIYQKEGLYLYERIN